MKTLLKITLTILFSIFGLLYIFLAPVTYEFFILWHPPYAYSYADHGDGRVWPFIALGCPLFAALWGWVGANISKNLGRGFLQCVAIMMGTLVFFLVTYKFWSVMDNGKGNSAIVNGLYTIIWWLVSFISAVLARKLRYDPI